MSPESLMKAVDVVTSTVSGALCMCDKINGMDYHRPLTWYAVLSKLFVIALIHYPSKSDRLTRALNTWELQSEMAILYQHSQLVALSSCLALVCPYSPLSDVLLTITLYTGWYSQRRLVRTLGFGIR